MGRRKKNKISNIEIIVFLYSDILIERWLKIKEKFKDKKFDECWLINPEQDFYVFTTIEYIRTSWHVISYIANYNKIPEQVIMHLCNNKNCVNPNHLMAGTDSDNFQYARFFHDRYNKELAPKGFIVIDRAMKLLGYKSRNAFKYLIKKDIVKKYLFSNTSCFLINDINKLKGIYPKCQ